jgi:TPP-dependent 2-oxoacid decarboxylase
MPSTTSIATTSVGVYLANRLEDAGIRHYFTVPGDFNLLLLDEMLHNERLTLVGCCNELNAAYAADGYARANGIAAVVITFGVGGLSALNAVACAYAEDIPLIVVIGGLNSGSGARDQLIHHGLGEVRYDYERRMYAQVTAGVFGISRLDDAPALIDQAIRTALLRRKPVMIEVACDLANRQVTAPRPMELDPRPVSDPVALADAVARAVSRLDAARRPVLVGGSKLRRPGVTEALRVLAERSGYPVAVMPGGKGLFPEDHPAFAGLYWGSVSDPGVQELVESSGLALFVGTILSDYATCGFTAKLDPERMILAMPEDIRCPGAFHANVGLADFLSGLATLVRPRERSEYGPTTFESPAGNPPAEPADARLTTAELARQVRDALGRIDGGALMVETGDSWFHGLETRLPAGRRFEIQFQAGSIGWSVPATLGYALGGAAPTRVLTLVGDGSFQLTAQEVSTMIRYGVRPILILLNNHGYIIEDAIHEGPYNRIKNWDYAGLMEVFTHGEGRGLGLRAKTAGELASALARAIEYDGPSLIEADIDPKDCHPKLRTWGRLVAAANRKPTQVV